MAERDYSYCQHILNLWDDPMSEEFGVRLKAVLQRHPTWLFRMRVVKGIYVLQIYADDLDYAVQKSVSITLEEKANIDLLADALNYMENELVKAPQEKGE